MTIWLSSISFITPLPPPILTLFPIFKCPEMPAWPPIETLLPIFELPAKVDGKRMADAEWSATIVDRKEWYIAQA